MSVPGLEHHTDMLGLTSADHAFLLLSHFNDLLDGAVHRVHVQQNTLTATTQETEGRSAEDNAYRLRHELINSDGESDGDLGLGDFHTLRMRPPHGILTREKREICTKLNDALTKTFNGPIFHLASLLVRLPVKWAR